MATVSTRGHDDGTMRRRPIAAPTGVVTRARGRPRRGRCDLPSLCARRVANARRLSQTSFLYAADGALITQLHAGENRIGRPLTDDPRRSSATR